MIKRIIQNIHIKNFQANKEYTNMLKEMKQHKHISYQENKEQKKKNYEDIN